MSVKKKQRITENRALSLDEFELGIGQILGPVRLVPVLRRTPLEGLRLRATQRAAHNAVYTPHGTVFIGAEGARLTYGTTLDPALDVPDIPDVHLSDRHIPWPGFVVQNKRSKLRWLPLHVALEGLLHLHVRGPWITWREYTDDVLRRGLSPRLERFMHGSTLPRLADALRIFERLEHQIGVLLYIGDRLATAFIAPHPDDYQALHQSLIGDVYADTLQWVALSHSEVPNWTIETASHRVQSIDDLAAFLSQTRTDFQDFAREMAQELFGHNHRFEHIRGVPGFSLERFRPTFALEDTNHVGDAIFTDDGRLAYMKTVRLSDAQVRRGYLLGKLAAAQWQLKACAEGLGTDVPGLVRRMNNAGFGYMLKPGVIRAAAHPQR